MLVREVLLEGMIKLPEKLWKKLSDELHSAMYSYMRERLTQVLKYQKIASAGPLKLFDDSYKKHYPDVKERKIDLKQKSFSRTIGMIGADDIPEYSHLFDRSKFQYFHDAYDRPLKLIWEFDHKEMAKKQQGGVFHAKYNNIVINLKPIKTLMFTPFVEACEDLDSEDEDDRKAAEKKVNYFLSTMLDSVEAMEHVAKHEMMHFVQFNVLARGSYDQVKSELADGNLISPKDRPSYYASNLEFGPQIVSAVGNFVTDWKHLQRDSKAPKSGWKSYAQFMTGALSQDKLDKALDIKPGVIRSIEPYPFFDALKKKSANKWKRACKYFYQELEKKYK